jgi:tetratricopeptide (TPR) repeat protein
MSRSTGGGRALLLALALATPVALHLGLSADSEPEQHVARHAPAGEDAPTPLAPPPRVPVFAVESEAPAVVEAAPVREGVSQEVAAKNQRALALLESGAHDEAVALLEECLRSAPAHVVLCSNLAEALWRRAHARDLGRVEGLELGVADLERAESLAPARSEIPARRAEWEKRLAAQRGMWTDMSVHFALSYDGERSDLLASYSDILAVLEDAYGEYSLSFAISPVEEEDRRISVVLYRKDQFRAATGIGHWAGGLYDGVVRVPVEDLSRERAQLSRVLRHELAHAFVARRAKGRAPGWLNEGLSMRLEADDAAWRARVEDALRSARGSPRLAAADLDGSLASLADEARVRAAYATAVLCCDAIEREGGVYALFDLVAAAGEGRLSERVERIAGSDFAGLLARVHERLDGR